MIAFAVLVRARRTAIDREDGTTALTRLEASLASAANILRKVCGRTHHRSAAQRLSERGGTFPLALSSIEQDRRPRDLH